MGLVRQENAADVLVPANSYIRKGSTLHKNNLKSLFNASPFHLNRMLSML